MSILSVNLDDLSAVVTAMDELAVAGKGWINLVPAGVERTELSSTRSVPGMIFGRVGGRGPRSPKVTWTAPEPRGTRTTPAQIGIEHPAGSRAAQRLAEAGLAVPTGWPVLQDHAIRGLVVAVADPQGEADHPAQLRWALAAAGTLSGAPVDTWQAQVFQG